MSLQIKTPQLKPSPGWHQANTGICSYVVHTRGHIYIECFERGEVTADTFERLGQQCEARALRAFPPPPQEQPSRA